MDLKILHANANVLMVTGLKSALLNGGGIEQIEHVANEEDLFASMNKVKYDLIIIDPLSSGFFTIDTTYKLKEKYSTQKVLVISDIRSTVDVLRILERGVQGYLTRQCDEDEIKHAVFAVAKGEKFYCNKVLDIILNKSFSDEEEVNCEPTVLTERESEITTLIASGLTNREIGEKLHLSHHTVHTHRKNIIKKLGVKSISELTVYAMNVGLISA